MLALSLAMPVCAAIVVLGVASISGVVVVLVCVAIVVALKTKLPKHDLILQRGFELVDAHARFALARLAANVRRLQGRSRKRWRWRNRELRCWRRNCWRNRQQLRCWRKLG